MRDIILALDPGLITGWALIRRADKAPLGLGDLTIDDVGCAIDILVRSMHLSGYSLEGLVEAMPVPGGTPSQLGHELAFVRRMIDHELIEVFELDVTYVLPGTWKQSRVALTTAPPVEWNGSALSPHMRDAYTMGQYYARKRS